jgi:hypothetical protein
MNKETFLKFSILIKWLGYGLGKGKITKHFAVDVLYNVPLFQAILIWLDGPF